MESKSETPLRHHFSRLYNAPIALKIMANRAAPTHVSLNLIMKFTAVVLCFLVAACSQLTGARPVAVSAASITSSATAH